MRRVFMGNKWRGEELLEMWAALLLLLEEAVADALTGGALDKLVAEAVACGCGIGGCGVSRQGCGLALPPPALLHRLFPLCSRS